MTKAEERRLQRAGGGRALERAVREASPSELQVVDSVEFEPRAAVARLVLPRREEALRGFFVGEAGAATRAALRLVLVDVQNWQLISRAAEVCAPAEEERVRHV